MSSGAAELMISTEPNSGYGPLVAILSDNVSGGGEGARSRRDTAVALITDGCERGLDALGTVARSMMAPWGGAEACVDAYEDTIRMATDAQLSVARSIPVEPISAFVASCAHLTRDVGATHLSGMRWLLDV